MTDSVAGAIFAPIGLYFVTRILDNIEAIGKIRYVFPTHYIDRGRPVPPVPAPTQTCTRAG